MRIYIVRHGETDWNTQRRFQGLEDIPMNPNGISQANTTGQALADLDIDLIIYSPLSRAHETARIIAGYTHTDELICEPGLLERDFGKLSGKVISDLYDFPECDMEPETVVCERVKAVLERYEKQGCSSILAVSHGGTIRALFRGVTDRELSKDSLRLKNACISILDLENGKYRLGNYNMTAEEFKAL